MGCTSYLATLNPEQRRAVEHGVATTGANIAGPLLVIAGAGSGKTNTLAHRVAHLIVHGIDPGRILLLTFSRRAAADMERQAQRIVAKRDRAGVIRSPGREPSMPSAPGCYGCRRARSASTRPSPFTTARI